MTTPIGSGEYKFYADRVRAMQFTPESFRHVIDWMREHGRAVGSYSNASRPYRLDLPKPGHGGGFGGPTLRVDEGDWIVLAGDSSILILSDGSFSELFVPA